MCRPLFVTVPDIFRVLGMTDPYFRGPTRLLLHFRCFAHAVTIGRDALVVLSLPSRACWRVAPVSIDYINTRGVRDNIIPTAHSHHNTAVKMFGGNGRQRF